MTTFDPSQHDIPDLVGRLRDQRFDGYSSEDLAREVEKFQSGGGTASMGTAVDALKSVVGMLAQTDTTLREQLSALGVSWQSKAGGQASAVMSEQAGFASQAYDNVSAAAQSIFDQGEAFNRTRNKLPDPQTLRNGDNGFTFGDTLFSLFGFETDHAGAVKSSMAAKMQAIDALNSYAHDSGDYIASSQAVPAPQSVELNSPPGSVILPNTGPVPDVPANSPTVAAGAKDVCPAPAPHSEPAYRAPAGSQAPTPPMGFAAPAAGPSGATQAQSAPSSTPTPSSPNTTPITELPGGKSGGGYQDTARPTPGGTPATPPYVPGQQVTGVGTPGGGGGSAWGKPGTGGGGDGFTGGRQGLPGQGGGQGPLGQGKMFGATAQEPSSAAKLGPAYTLKGGPGGVGPVADSATAIGAAAAGGATAGEQERTGRGFGRSKPGGGKPVRQMNIGDLPEEEEAQRADRATPETSSRERTRAILEPAATQDGDEDAEHVRRFGVDDRDLFTDRRQVSPDLIGERPISEDR